MTYFQKSIGHLKTITKHRHLVIRHCAKAGILWQGLKHDLSKYFPAELIPGIRYYSGNKSPNEGERRELGYSRAWLHHKGRNKHHYEYWTDYSAITKKMEPVEMPYRYIAEMFCDRVAASKVYNGDKYTDSFPLAYYNAKAENRLIHEKTKEELELLLNMLNQQGEAVAFQYIRNRLKDGKKQKNMVK